MRKLLLFTFILSFITVVSCSKDEEDTKVSQDEKEYLVKQTIIEFNNSAIKTGKYEAFIKDVSQKSATTPLNKAELKMLIQNFLGDQTQKFLDVYYQLEALELTSEEFYGIAHQFEYLRLTGILDKTQGGCCGIANNSGDSLFKDFLGFTCGCDAA
ncbi:hypothetical protein [Aquimarina sp. MAR_2010_214]|uniref:hypothetical protein n=1 Tax=Aquimarina sp. MAR_2010_214 TaxID=1250026 RepID=UPI001177FF37|nr:hypothetical protein [Aquimarina sp. MAR_2010_214]